MRILRTAAGQGGTRQVQAGGGRLHVAVHGVNPDHLDAFAVDLEARAGCLPGVAWAAFDAGCGRLVVAGVSSAGPDEGAVVAAVEAAEATAGASGSFAGFVAEHPADRIGTARHTLEATADVAAIITAATGAASAVLRLPQRWVPVDLGAVIGLIQNQDRLRGPLERRFGTSRTDAALSMAGAAAHGLRQRMLAPSVDLVQRVLLVRQEDSRAATFIQLEPALYSCPPTPVESAPRHPVERPVPLPGGPIELYADSALVATVAGTSGLFTNACKPARSSSSTPQVNNIESQTNVKSTESRTTRAAIPALSRAGSSSRPTEQESNPRGCGGWRNMLTGNNPKNRRQPLMPRTGPTGVPRH